MRKILFASIALLLFSMQAKAQKYFDVYQDGKVTTSIASTNVDSIGLTGDTFQNRKVNFYRNGKAVNSYLVSTVDSIKVFRIDEEQLVYLGVVGFNQELYEKPIDVLATSTSNFYTTYVDNLARKDGTLLYYAVDHALDMLKTASFPTPLTSVNLVTFTDGLDQGSLMMNSNYSTEEQYMNAVSSRIASTKVKGLPVTAYSLGLRGSDVTDYELFQKNLDKLASSSEKAFEVSNMGAVRTRLQEICDQIISISNRQTFSLKIPGRSNGTLIRFTFDGNTADNSALYIEGTFNLANRSLTNVTYHGIKATSGSFVQGTQDGIFVTFTFTGMQREDGNGLIPKEDIREYYRMSGATTWQQNSEFTPNNNTQTTVTHSGAVIMLVLDCSSSLGSQFSDMKYYAQDFINRVAENTQEFTLEAPKNVMATLTDDFTVNINWDAVKHAESYVVCRNSQESGTYKRVSPDLKSNNWTDSEPLEGYNYYVIVSRGHGLESYDWDEVVNINCKLESPTNVKATITDDFTIQVVWDGVKGAEMYDVYRSSNSSNGFSKVATGVTKTMWEDKSPLSGNNYYRVCAVGHGISSIESAPSAVVTYKLDAPTNVIVTVADDGTIRVSWDKVKYAESYEVYRSSSSSGGFSKVATAVSKTYWTDDNPFLGDNYYKVYAIGHSCVSDGSEISEVANINKFTIIREQPEGELRIYSREGRGTFADEFFRDESQEGLTSEVVFSQDGKKVYFKNIISHAKTNTWVEGDINGNTITIPLGQMVYWFDKYNYGLRLARVKVNGSLSSYTVDSSGSISFSIEENRLVLKSTYGNSSSMYYDGLALVYTDNYEGEWSYYLDYETIFTYTKD